jgi:hypothetical protein
MPVFIESVNSAITLAGAIQANIAIVPRQIRSDGRNRALQTAIYALKTSRPSRVLWHKVFNTTTDHNTGAKRITYDSLILKRAVVLDGNVEAVFSKFFNAGSYLSEAGINERGFYVILIDVNDVPRRWGAPSTEDFFVIGASRLQPKLIRIFGNHVYSIICAETVGQPITRHENSGNSMTLEQFAEGAI